VDGGYPALCGGFLGMQPTMPGRQRVGGQNVTVPFIASHLLANFAQRPAIDQTGLGGRFDVVLEFVPEPNTPGDVDSQPEVLAIDHVERPSEN
jgi:uncharacterized protein (TIGR03435 family)